MNDDRKVGIISLTIIAIGALAIIGCLAYFNVNPSVADKTIPALTTAVGTAIGAIGGVVKGMITKT